MKARPALPASGNKLVGKRISVGNTTWQLTAYSAASGRFTATSLNVPGRSHTVAFEELRAGYADGIINVD